MVSRILVVGVGIVAPLALASASLGQITVLRPSAVMKWSVDGATAESAAIQGQILPNGKVQFIQSISTRDGLILGVNFTADVSNNPTASLAGAMTCANPTEQAHAMDLSFQLPLCPIVPGGTLFGGNVSIVVVTNANGGGVTCHPDADSIWQALINGQAVRKIFWCPFKMLTTGAGSMQSSSVFGTPIPGLPGPETAESLGSRIRFTLTDGELLTINTGLLVKSLGAPPVCPGDVTGDGFIDGNDLSVVLAHWGESGWCVPGDATDDGNVDGGDMGLVLSLWGPCDS